MASKTVRLQDLSKELGEFTEESLKVQKQAVVSGMVKSIPELVRTSPVDTGQYANSWDISLSETRAILGNFAPHAPVIERGARPFKPPIKPLLAWAKRVLKSSSQPPNYDSEVWGLARGVQKKIMEEGMQPKNVLEKALPKIIANIQKEFERLG